MGRIYKALVRVDAGSRRSSLREWRTARLRLASFLLYDALAASHPTAEVKVDRTRYPSGVLAFLLGGLAGAGVALLLAPHSGRATRDAVGRRVRDGVDAARGVKERMVGRGRELKEEAGRAISDVLEAAGDERADESYRADTRL